MTNHQGVSLLATLLSINCSTLHAFTQPQFLLRLSGGEYCYNGGGGALSLASIDDITDDITAEKKGMALLKFVGEATTITDQVPIPPQASGDGKSLAAFFSVDGHRDLLMRGINNVVEPMEANKELMERWTAEAERVGAVPPEEGDPLLQVTTAGIQFPGLKILSVATIGAKLIVDDESGYPVHEFTLVKDTIRAEGPRPIRFIFNKLIATRDEEAKEQTTHSLTRTTATSTDSDDQMITFTSSSYLEVDVSFPKVLLRILPVSKEKAEEQGSQSILKTIEKDSGPALESFKHAYLEYVVKK